MINLENTCLTISINRNIVIKLVKNYWQLLRINIFAKRSQHTNNNERLLVLNQNMNCLLRVTYV